MTKSAVDIVRAYGIEAWNGGHDEWIPDLCADPIIRHDANREVRLSHAEQRARMRHNYLELRPVFEEIVLTGDHEYVTLVWNATGRDPNWKLCGIEVFRILDGRITEVWNSPYMDGRWGLSKSLAGSVQGAGPVELPLVRSDLTESAGRIDGTVLVPVDAVGIKSWLAHLFGKPETERLASGYSCRFSPGGERSSQSLTVSDKAGPDFYLTDVSVPLISIELERSGLVNATISLSAVSVPAKGAGELTSTPPVRLAETVGTFSNDKVEATVADVAVTIASDGKAFGRLSLRLADPQLAPGEGLLSFGWREGQQSLILEGKVTLSPPSSAFLDGDIMEAAFDWQGDEFIAILTNPEEAAV